MIIVREKNIRDLQFHGCIALISFFSLEAVLYFVTQGGKFKK